MTTDKLDAALTAVNWNSHVAAFLAQSEIKKSVAACNLRLALWSKQLEQADAKNPALAFIREMQFAGHMVVALTSLALYKPAASSIRTVIETALYYTYFRSHPSELATLLREKTFYLEKKNIIEYHRVHTNNFKPLQEKLGLLARLDKSYGSLSAIVHGQLPGMWSSRTSLGDTAPIEKTMKEVIQRFIDGEEVVHYLFLCTIAPLMWDDFSPSAKKPLLRGLAGDTKALLGLDER